MTASAVVNKSMKLTTAPLILLSCTMTACNPDQKIASVIITQPSGQPLADVVVMFGRGSAIPFKGNSGNDGRLEHERLSGDGELILIHNKISVFIKTVNKSWPVRLTWPVNVSTLNVENTSKAGTVTILRADKSKVNALTATTSHPPYEVANDKRESKPVLLENGHVVRLNSETPFRLHLESGNVSILLRFPDSGLPESFELVWPE